MVIRRRTGEPAVERGLDTTHDDADAALVGRVATGEVAALGQLYDRFGRQVYSLVRHVCGDPALAEDVTGAVFLAARHHAECRPPEGPVGTWLLTLAHGRAVSAARRAGGTGATTPAAELADARVRGVLAGLPPAQARVVAMGYFGGRAHTETAASSGRSPDAVAEDAVLAMARLRRGLRVSDEAG